MEAAADNFTVFVAGGAHVLSFRHKDNKDRSVYSCTLARPLSLADAERRMRSQFHHVYPMPERNAVVAASDYIICQVDSNGVFFCTYVKENPSDPRTCVHMALGDVVGVVLNLLYGEEDDFIRAVMPCTP